MSQKQNPIVCLRLKISAECDGVYTLKITGRDGAGTTDVFFSPADKKLSVSESGEWSDFLKSNAYQFRKLLHNKKRETFFVGFELSFSMIDQKEIAAFNDKHNIIVTHCGTVYVCDKMGDVEIELYTDGSYDEQSGTGAIGYAWVKSGKIIEAHYKIAPSKSSSHLELLAVIGALESAGADRIRIYTDSQYVRKGITEWIWHWKENRFTTANGTEAKNRVDWMKLDRLIEARYIEWVWIKGHRDNDIHNHVDLKTREKSRGLD